MFIRPRFYKILLSIAALTAVGQWFHPMYYVGCVLLVAFAAAVVAEIVLLFSKTSGITARRVMSERLSNGDNNEVLVPVKSSYKIPLKVDVVDEIPDIFQRRDLLFPLTLAPGEERTIKYDLRPTKRGVYTFGMIRVFVRSVIGLVERRYSCGEKRDVKVYPSYLMLNKYQLLAAHNDLTEMGIKKVRKIANKTDFEQIKDYVPGDDYRTINWKATARRNSLMVNVYQDEKSQQVLCLIDKGRVMQQAFNGMTLLDYAINASLVLSYISINKEDKAGLITYDKAVDSYIKPEKNNLQMQLILESLYSQTTTFGETDYSELCVSVRRNVTKRSLLIVFTNFLGISSLNRQLPYFKQLSSHHVVLVVFFDDNELEDLEKSEPYTINDYYTRVIAHRMRAEKRLIVSTLWQNGVYSLLTKPENLTVDVINKYLEMKAKNQF